MKYEGPTVSEEKYNEFAKMVNSLPNFYRLKDPEHEQYLQERDSWILETFYRHRRERVKFGVELHSSEKLDWKFNDNYFYNPPLNKLQFTPTYSEDSYKMKKIVWDYESRFKTKFGPLHSYIPDYEGPVSDEFVVVEIYGNPFHASREDAVAMTKDFLEYLTETYT